MTARLTIGLVVLACAAAGAGACGAPARPDPGHEVFVAENTRAEDTSPLLAALSSDDARLQRAAARALGRLERAEHGGAVVALAAADDPDVRREAANALGQMKAPVDLSAWLQREPDAGVRAAIYQAIGRLPPIVGVTEATLVEGLAHDDARARRGAAHGLEALIRLNARALMPAPATVLRLREATRDPDVEVRELSLAALNGARDRDRPTLLAALQDPEPQVRRLAVIGLREWVDDPSPIVRYDTLRLSPTCDRAAAALDDASGHVVLLAVDLLGTLPCPAGTIEPLVGHASWRVRARALVSLARVDPDAARRHLPAVAADPAWQARAYAARAARMLGAGDVRAALAVDPAPNVVIAAMTEPAEAIRALGTSHRGLLMAAAERLEGGPDLPAAVLHLLAAFQRLSREDRPTSRDARLALLDRLREAPLAPGSASVLAGALRPWLADRDPAVAARVAGVISRHTGAHTEPVTTRYADASLPPAAYIDGLRGARAIVTMREAGTFTMDLLTDEAPATVGIVARHAERGGYNGTTFHRVVPNFVLQGGSPGAHEMDGAVGPFMRDELGLVGHLRGTLGISTRGRDTGDGQIFINLVDNFRLDHQYTVWARVVEGMDVVDRILEGDVIERVEIRRARP